MGFAIAEALRDAGCRVHLVAGPVEIPRPTGVEFHPVVSALEMQAAAEAVFASCDVVFAVAAVADYRPRTRLPGKPPKGRLDLHLELVPNPDIIAGLATRKGGRTLVGFALESASGEGDVVAAALVRGRDKLRRKGLDMIVVNFAGTLGASHIEAWVLGADGSEAALPACTKPEFARLLVEKALALVAARRNEVRP